MRSIGRHWSHSSAGERIAGSDEVASSILAGSTKLQRKPTVDLLAYRVLFTTSLLSGLFLLTDLFDAPPGLRISFALHTAAQIALAVAAFARLKVLQGERVGKPLPGWTNLWKKALSWSIAAFVGGIASDVGS